MWIWHGLLVILFNNNDNIPPVEYSLVDEKDVTAVTRHGLVWKGRVTEASSRGREVIAVTIASPSSYVEFVLSSIVH